MMVMLAHRMPVIRLWLYSNPLDCDDDDACTHILRFSVRVPLSRRHVEMEMNVLLTHGITRSVALLKRKSVWMAMSARKTYATR